VFLHAWVSAVFSFVFQIMAYVRRIRYEEAMMIERLGDRYIAYTRDVRAMVPLLW
jgi:protein-S-isoprenylcysteine O-methyltransferase